MRIGELARRAEVTTRMVRYYEQAGLLRPARDANGYRSYDEDDLGRVQQISHLVRAGLGTRFVRAVLDMGLTGQDPLPGWTGSCSDVLAQELRDELERLEEHLACLTRSRDTVRRYLDEVGREAVGT